MSLHPIPVRLRMSRIVRSTFWASSRSDSASMSTTGSPSSFPVHSVLSSCFVLPRMTASASRTIRCVDR